MAYSNKNDDFDKLNIVNLFSTQSGNAPHTNGKLDINTLFGKNINSKDEFIFDSNMLLNNAKKRKQQLDDCYFSHYKSCCDNITSASNDGRDNVIVSIPEIDHSCIGYNSLDCLKLIEDKLQEQSIECARIKNSKTKIFVTWKELINKELSKESNKVV